MKLHPKVRNVLNACLLAFSVWATLGILLNSKELKSVSVNLLANGIEHTDKTILGVGHADKAADYQLKLRTTKDDWIDLGTFANTPIGNGLAFTPNDSIPTRILQEVQLIDHDTIESDILERGPLTDGAYQGRNYSIDANSAFNLQAGFNWFFATPVGLAILAGIGTAVLLFILSNLS